jgi:hypothetical protein
MPLGHHRCTTKTPPSVPPPPPTTATAATATDALLDGQQQRRSCIDGRLTSAWNWCSQLQSKPFYPIFKLAGFTSFDGTEFQE